VSVDEARGRFARDGFTVLPFELAAGVRDALVRALDDGLGPDPGRNPYGVLRNNIWTKIPIYRELLMDGGLVSAATALHGAPLVLFQDNLIWKPPGTEHEVSFHQDYSYWPLSAPAGVTLWLALDDADEDNGCLKYVPGSHLEGERCPTDFVPGTNQPARSELPPLDPTGRPVAAMPLRAGQLLAHHPLVWHMSPANRTNRDRRAYSLTLLDESVAWNLDHAPHPFAWALQPEDGGPVRGALFPRFPL
jgi:hypothetical protein